MKGYKELTGKTDYSEIYWDFVTALAKRMEVNKAKYEKHNYRKPLDREELLQAALRHLIKVIEPQKSDPETSIDHITSIACNMMMYYYQHQHYPTEKITSNAEWNLKSFMK